MALQMIGADKMFHEWMNANKHTLSFLLFIWFPPPPPETVNGYMWEIGPSSSLLVKGIDL